MKYQDDAPLLQIFFLQDLQSSGFLKSFWTQIFFPKNKEEIFFLSKKFEFKNFLKSQDFVNEVGKISEAEGHHPDISFGWGYAVIKVTTHAIKGLSENDFILAAKIDKITNA